MDGVLTAGVNNLSRDPLIVYSVHVWWPSCSILPHRSDPGDNKIKYWRPAPATKRYQGVFIQPDSPGVSSDPIIGPRGLAWGSVSGKMYVANGNVEVPCRTGSVLRFDTSSSFNNTLDAVVIQAGYTPYKCKGPPEPADLTKPLQPNDIIVEEQVAAPGVMYVADFSGAPGKGTVLSPIADLAAGFTHTMAVPVLWYDTSWRWQWHWKQDAETNKSSWFRQPVAHSIIHSTVEHCIDGSQLALAKCHSLSGLAT